jgi:MFS family permease
VKESFWKDENGKFYYGWVIVIIAALMCIFAYSAAVSVIGEFVLPVLTNLIGGLVAAGVPAAEASQQITATGLTFYITIMSITNIVVLAIFSKFFDEKNIKKMILIGCICGIAAFAIFANATSLMMFWIGAVPLGVCFSLVSMTPAMLLVTNWFGVKVRGKAISIFLAIMSVGTAGLIKLLHIIIYRNGVQLDPVTMAPPTADTDPNTIIWSGLDTTTAYYVLAVGVAILIPICLAGIKWAPAQKGIKRIGDIEEMSVMPDPSMIPGVTFRDAVKRPITWFAFISVTFIVIVSSAILTHGIPTMIYSGYTPDFANSSVSIMSIFMIFTGLLLGYLSDKLPLSATAVGTVVIFMICALGLSLLNVGQPIWFWAYIIGYMLGVPAVNLITPLLMIHMYGEKEVGRLIGYSNVFVSLGGVFGSMLVAYLYDISSPDPSTKSYHMAWLVCVAILAITAIIRAVCSSKKMKYRPESSDVA